MLWDIDGTLLQRASAEHSVAMRRALIEVHGVDEPSLDAARVEAAGRTDGAIARDLVTACGVDGFDAARVRQLTCRFYAQEAPEDLSARLAPGVPETLGRLAGDGRFRLSLLTGNFEPVARLKLERAGIGGFFAEGQGAFGSDAEERDDLVPIARERAGGWPRERTVVIGDTPRDIACARADGVRVVAVTTGPFEAAALQGADAVVDGAPAAARILDGWA